MLSTDQPPHPEEEMRWHAEECARRGRTVVATTRLLSGLKRGESIVAFYGNAAMANRFLGQGLFAGFARADQPRGQKLLASMTLYSNGNRPEGIQGAIELTDVRLAERSEALESLGATLEGSGLPLALANLPDGPSRACVYFLCRAR